MKIIFLFICIHFFLCTHAQVEIATSTSQSISGGIYFPSLQSLNVEITNPEPIHFSSPVEYNNGKVVEGFCRVTVVSNVPWIVTVKSASAYLFGNHQALTENIPASIFEIKEASSGNFIKLSQADYPFLISNNNKVLNIYNLDLKANPSWNYSGGSYNMNIVFTLTPQ